MKSLSKLFLAIVMLVLVAACGKDNKSGQKNNSWDSNGYCSNSYNCSTSQLNMDYNYRGASIESVVHQSPCLTGSSQRMQWQSQVRMGYVVQRGDVYVGVTSYGDVGMLIGNGTAQATFRAYICARSGQPMQIAPNPLINVATMCRFKPIVALTVGFSSGEFAAFRMLDGGRGFSGQPYSMCTGY